MIALSLIRALALSVALPEATSASHKRPKRRTSLAGLAFTPPSDIEGWDAAPALAHPDIAPVFNCSGPEGSSDATEYQCKFTFFGYTHEFTVSEIVSVIYADDAGATEQWFVPCDAPPAPCVALDLAPPDTTITGGPAGTVASRDAHLAFASSEGGSSFECRLDAGSWEHCSSPRRYSVLPDGDHRLVARLGRLGVRATARASDPLGNIALNSRTFILTAPRD